jgi:chromosome segregation protein
MLKAIELVGFKSFAERTRFDLPPGITAIVGPNGSGKSNVVDAVKWVLGEQSVKSLRGKEMIDCIFNGSATRPPLNAAEATLIFDNSQRRLAIDAAEVQITRRVYRSGEGEYLINRQPCRLRDIRDLFAGTGVATDAYAVIEQGKVDVLLQASPRDRRAVFEEAAGISRFKAKKIECQRRLERVEQNLLRLSDIVEEVGSRLRAVRMQAAKARKYRELADRLQSLRTHVGLVEWRRLSDQLRAEQEVLARLAETADREQGLLSRLEADAQALEAEWGRSQDALRACETQYASQREQIATLEAAVAHQRTRLREREEEGLRLRRQLAALQVKAGGQEQQLQHVAQQVAEAEAIHVQLSQELHQAAEQLARLDHLAAQLRADEQSARQRYLECVRHIASLDHEASIAAAQCEAAAAAAERVDARQTVLQGEIAALAAELEEAQSELRQAEDEAARLADAWKAAQEELQRRRGQAQHAAEQLHVLRNRAAALEERRRLLAELEARHVGLSDGVRQVLTAISAPPADSQQKLPGILGLVADLLPAPLEHAQVLELALAERAQYIVVEPDTDLAQLASLVAPLEARVTFLPLPVETNAPPAALASPQAAQRGIADVAETLPPQSPPEPTSNPGMIGHPQPMELDAHPGVVSRADRLIDCQQRFRPLARRLLGTTWIVKTLQDALALHGTMPDRVYVAQTGELLHADGSLAIGPPHVGGGVVSRKSELRALEAEQRSLAEEIERAATVSAELAQTASEQEQAVQALSARQLAATERLSAARLRRHVLLQRKADLAGQLQDLEPELAQIAARRKQAEAQLARLRERLAAAQADLASHEAVGDSIRSRLAELELQRREAERLATRVQVDWAKSEERLASLRARREQSLRDQHEQRRAVQDSQTHLQQALRKARQAEAAILASTAGLAEMYLEKERLARLISGHEQQSQACQLRRAELQGEIQAARQRLATLESQRHTHALAAESLRMERQALAARLREDYGIELAALEHEPTAEEALQREAAEQEIAELRRRLQAMGNVNLEALDELDGLEARFSTLSAQHEDLVKAKNALLQIIQRINADSRRLFADTLEAVRGNFQGLFRKLFGGGQADIVLDPAEDILECGIEIVAQPPGKELRSISLLSGGEKTLTCVALLLAVFQYRPSPFCVLDEVDAALDEANIDRFVAVLQEFLSWTQFIIVTHSKSTMTCAQTLHGVTMQESGVSKRVSVRFEDISADGRLVLPPATAAADNAGSSDGQPAAKEAEQAA